MSHPGVWNVKAGGWWSQRRLKAERRR